MKKKDGFGSPRGMTIFEYQKKKKKSPLEPESEAKFWFITCQNLVSFPNHVLFIRNIKSESHTNHWQTQESNLDVPKFPPCSFYYMPVTENT